MKRKIGILLCLALLTLCAIALADITLETDQYFKDATFREQVRINFDENYDKQLSDDEIAKATFIVVSDMDITSLKGIEYLVSLETLGCHGNKLTSVDLSANKELKFLELWDNQLGTLDVTQNTKLTHLSCEGNQLKTLDLSKNTVLSELYCNGNQITTLDVSNCPSLCSAMENNERIVTTDDHHRFGNYFHIDKDVTVIGRNGKISKPENGELPVVEGSIKWSDLHYSFANTAKDVNYSSDDITMDIYERVFSWIQAYLLHSVQESEKFGGWCAGFAMSSALFNAKGSGLNLIAFGANKVSELGINYVSAAYAMTVKQLIEVLHVAQFKSDFQNAKVWDNLNSLVETVINGINTGYLPYIGLHYSKDKGHALVPYKLQYIDSKTDRLFVYDCAICSEMEGGNFKYITLTKDSEGNYVKWFYTVDGRDVGTDYASRIFYVLNQKMSSLWNNRIKSKDVDHKWLTAVSGNNWKIVSGGSALAEMNNGSFTGSGQIEKYLGDGIADKYSLLYSKDGNFSVVNTSSEETFEADVAGLSQGAMVKTTSGSITFAINDATGTNQVILDGREGDTFEATFRSALGSASGKETMTISGKSQGSEVVIGLSGSDVVVNNCTDVAIMLNDAPVTNLEDLGKNINFYDINLEYTEAAYNGSPIEPGIIVSGREMIPGTDYTISYKDNIGIPGETTTAAAIIQGTGSYTGTKTLLFTILPGKDLSGCRISEIKDQVYTGKAITPKFTVTYDGTALVIETDYTVTWKNNQKIGTATLTVTGKRMCTGTKSVTFRIIPKAVKLSSLKAGRKQLTVKWKAGKEIDGYEIQYGLKKNFKGAKTITVKKAKTVSAELKKLKSKKTYYVRIRAFKKVKGKKYYSDWSKTLSKKVK